MNNLFLQEFSKNLKVKDVIRFIISFIELSSLFYFFQNFNHSTNLLEKLIKQHDLKTLILNLNNEGYSIEISDNSNIKTSLISYEVFICFFIYILVQYGICVIQIWGSGSVTVNWTGVCVQVMECGWDRLVKQIDTAESLEDVIQVNRSIFKLI